MTTGVALGDFVTEFRKLADGWNTGVALNEVTPEDNLFDAGVLDSFSVARVIVLLERLRGTEIDLEQASIESFASMATIHRTFLSG